MIRRCRGDWTAIAIDEVLPILFPKSGRATQFFENPECSINSLSSCFVLELGQMFIGHGSPRGAHASAEMSWLNLT